MGGNFCRSRTINIIGGLLSLTGIIFIAIQLEKQRLQLDLTALAASTWVLLATLTIVYAGANSILAIAWMNLLNNFNAGVSQTIAMSIYATSLPAKYIPGNIMQLAGRHALGIAREIKGWALAKAALYEIALLALAGSLLSMLVLPQFVDQITPGVAFSLSILGVSYTALRLKTAFNRMICAAFLEEVLFLIISGLLFIITLWIFSSEPGHIIEHGSIICGAYILAWTAGFVTPGAPAGVGIREMVLVYCLKSYSEESVLLTSILVSRTITVIGDALFFGILTALSHKARER